METKKPLTYERSSIHVAAADLMFPLRAGFGTLMDRLPGGRQASSLAPLNMNMFVKQIYITLRSVVKKPSATVGIMAFGFPPRKSTVQPSGVAHRHSIQTSLDARHPVE
jgi:hypothetical protein